MTLFRVRADPPELPNGTARRLGRTRTVPSIGFITTECRGRQLVGFLARGSWRPRPHKYRPRVRPRHRIMFRGRRWSR